MEDTLMLTRLFSRSFYAMILASTLIAVVPSASAFASEKSYTITAPDGVKLAVQESGKSDGPPIIFIHGLLGSHLNWDAQLKSPRLRKYRLITYDLRGHGLSGKPKDAKSYSDGRRWANDLAAVIEASHVRRPVLVGWSLGGTVISNYLAAFGDKRIAGAVYVDGVIELKPDQIVAHPQVYRDLNSPDLGTHLDAERTFLGLCFYKKPASSTFERLLANAATASWDMQRNIQSVTVAASQGLSRAYVPILLIYGAHDALVQSTPAINRAKALHPRIQSKLYAGSGHTPFLEEAERFDRDLAAFVAATLRR